MRPISCKILTLFFTLFIVTGCSVEPKPIPYGEANCAHCNMTVTDNRYGAELVNDKGKAFFFDSAECLAAYATDHPELLENAAFLMVTDFINPGNLLDARNAYFLQSEALPSPMGMNLTAFSDNLTMKQLEQKHGGNSLTWEQVLTVVKNDAKFQR